MTSNKEKSNKDKLLILLLLLVTIASIVGIAASSGHHATSSTSSAPTAPVTNNKLEACVDGAHGAYDGLVAIGEGSQHPSNTAKSLLDQAIAACHSRYGY